MSFKSEKPIHSLVAGATAGAVEAFVTYPTEFVKTRSQFGGKRESPLTIIRETVRSQGVRGLYAGCTALVIGNSVKAGVRFVSYDRFKQALADKDVSIGSLALDWVHDLWHFKGESERPAQSPGGVGRGGDGGNLCRYTLRNNQNKTDRRRQALLSRVSAASCTARCPIVREEGIRGIYRGLFPVMMRQGANSAIRFTTYTTLKQFVQSRTRTGQSLPSSVTFGIGAIAGLVTVYTTMPLDVIKTRMQSLEARAQYRNSLHCAYRIFTEEGLRRFWTGTTPRLARLVMSGGIVFTIYEKVIVLIGGRGS
ncbi:mitochondrial tricarboxylate transporter [Lactarius pseudohatsudake]|nr:mitochondrial tricarboxylate transporter [Lactarius pseudohatsudake]